MVKQFRLERNISQEDFCEGLCSVSTLSHIESGHCYPRKQLVDKLLQIMNLPMDVYSVNCDRRISTSQRDFLERRLCDMVFLGCYDYDALLEEYALSKRGMTGSERQFYIMLKAIKYEHNEGDIKEVCAMYIDALKCTLPHFSLESKKLRFFLTEYELFLLYRLSLSEKKEGDKVTAISLMYIIYLYVSEKMQDMSSIAHYYPYVLSGLAEWEDEASSYESEGIFANEGLSVCNRYDSLSASGRLLFYKAASVAGLEGYRNAKKLFDKAFCVLEAVRDYEFLQDAKDILGKRYALL